MNTLVVPSDARSSRTPSNSVKYSFSVRTDEFRSLPLPGFPNSKIGHCFVNVLNLPERLEEFMKVNPRVPSRNTKGVLSGPVIKGILLTLRESPDEMVLKNQGIYLLAETCEFKRLPGGEGELTVTMSDEDAHGVVNGGHTYAAIRDAVENAEPIEDECLKKAYVQLHVFQGIDKRHVAQIAEGLNRSKQVDDWSLLDLQKEFKDIQRVMKGKPGEDAISYSQGELGDVYISDVIVMLELFNRERFNEKNHPSRLYRRSSQALKYFQADTGKENPVGRLLMSKTPEILALGDKIRQAIPDAANRDGFDFGRLRVSNSKDKGRAGSPAHKNTPLPFIGGTMGHRVPNGWVFPILAAFRANVKWDIEKKIFDWIVPIDDLLNKVIDDLVRICVIEHRDNNVPPEQVGMRESIYNACYTVIRLYLSEMKETKK